MPIACPIQFPRITESQMRELDYLVMKQAFSVHNEVGRLCDESVYQALLLERVGTRGGLKTKTEVPVTASFRSFSKTYRLDFVVADSVIYELKSVRCLTTAHEAQLLNYLLMVDATRGKLINFREDKVKSRFANTSLNRQSRQQFQLTHDNQSTEHGIVALLQAMLSDWGTGLSGQLYLEAIMHEIVGDQVLQRSMPMVCDGISAGSQSFQLLDDQTALFVTTMKHDRTSSYCKNLQSKLSLSPLRSAVWANIDLHHVDCRVITGKRMEAAR